MRDLMRDKNGYPKLEKENAGGCYPFHDPKNAWEIELIYFLHSNNAYAESKSIDLPIVEPPSLLPSFPTNFLSVQESNCQNHS